MLPYLFYNRWAGNSRSALKKLVSEISFSHKLYQTKSDDVADNNLSSVLI